MGNGGLSGTSAPRRPTESERSGNHSNSGPSSPQSNQPPGTLFSSTTAATHGRSAANASVDVESPSNDMACDNCSARFTLFKTKKICRECKVQFCGSCMTGTGFKRICLRCKVLFATPPVRDDLMELRVKDLQRFIVSKKVSTKSCVEKKDLVELVIRIHGVSASTEEGFRNPRQAPAASCSSSVSEERKNFPKNYVQSTHREEWISKHNLHSDEDVVLDDFVVVNPVASGVTTNSSSSSVSETHEKTEDIVSSSTDEEQPQKQPEESDETASSQSHPQTAASSNTTTTSSSSHLTPAGAGSTAPPIAPTPSPKRFSHQELVQLTEIETEDDLLCLSVKQMKEILALNRVMFKGVIEKEELLKIVRRLWLQDKRNNEEKDFADDKELCKICMDAKVDCVMLECGHMCTCIACGKIMSECPICRRYVVRIVKIFKA